MIFLNLGNQPFANEYLIKKKQKEKKYQLLIDFNNNNKIVSIKRKFLSKEIFKNDYPYRSSISKTMNKSFRDLALKIKKKFKKKKILEIGCNDGVFLKNFKKEDVLGIEPCANIAKICKKKKLELFQDTGLSNFLNKLRKNMENLTSFFQLIRSLI